MMGLGWQEILDDTSLADSVEVQVGGKTATLGELRGISAETKKAQGNLTRWAQNLSERERVLVEREVPVDTRGAPQPVAGDDAEFSGFPEELRYAAAVDPHWRILLRTIAGTVKGLRGDLTQAQEKLKEHEQVWWTRGHLETLAALKRDDSSLDERALLQFATENRIANLAHAYKAFKGDDRVKAADEAGFKRGLEEGKKVAPPVPFGLRRPTLTPAPEPAAKTMAELTERASNDPEILKAYRDGLEGHAVE